MAWLAKDRNGHLFVYSSKPNRDKIEWLPHCDAFGIEDDYVKLPSDADEKLIGRHITWDDEPVKI